MSSSLFRLLRRLLVDDTSRRPARWEDMVLEAASLGVALQREAIRLEGPWYFIEDRSRAKAASLVRVAAGGTP